MSIANSDNTADHVAVAEARRRCCRPQEHKHRGALRTSAPASPAAVHRAILGPRRDPSGAGLSGVQLPLTSAELVSDGVCSELLALRRVSGGGVAKFADHYVDHGCLVSSYLTGVFDELADAGVLALAEQDPWGLRRVSLTHLVGAVPGTRLFLTRCERDGVSEKPAVCPGEGLSRRVCGEGGPGIEVAVAVAAVHGA